MPLRKQILVIDKNRYHFEILKELLSHSETRFGLSRADDLKEAESLLKSRHYELILSEAPDTLDMADWISDLKKKSHDASIVILTSENDQTRVIEAMKSGADDYILKNRENGNMIGRTIEKIVAKKKRRPLAETPQKVHGLSLLSRHLGTITNLMSHSSRGIALGKKQLKVLEREIENIKGMIRQLVH